MCTLKNINNRRLLGSKTSEYKGENVLRKKYTQICRWTESFKPILKTTHLQQKKKDNTHMPVI